ncbi:MAG TPA: MarR family winged helix-turn-helix transcriptional regulator [Gemmatimonadaceae bacterium]|nr:MarR family winged helix-turn-helix transcriptional regulator [Gemmatimonadaceae bacterium]
MSGSATKASGATAKCAAGTLRRATRSISRVYDARLAPAGLTATQFSLLSAVQRRRGPVRLTELADELVFERTSLYRNLTPLAREGLITLSNAGGRARQVALSAKGVRRIAQALPLWTAAQEDFLERFGRGPWNELAEQLVEIVDIARAMPGADG